ncbi:MAG: hypothetical protein WCD70_11045 [Alphaproteobacteria bacterium]
MLKNFTSAALVLCILSACSSQEIAVTYNCEPTGATLYEEGIGRVGTCPAIVKYSVYDPQVSNGHVHTGKINVVWVSGASLILPPMSLVIPPNQQTSLMITRPPDYPYYTKDQEFSLGYETSVISPSIKYVTTPYQSGADGFAQLDRDAACMWSGLIESAQGQCP